MIDVLIGFVDRFLDILLTVTFLKPVATFSSIVWTKLSVTELKLMRPRLLVLLRDISAILTRPDTTWAIFVADYLNRLTNGAVTAEDIQHQAIGSGSAAAMQGIGDAFLKAILNLVMISPAEVERNPMGAAERFLGLNLNFNMSGWLLNLFASTYSMGRVKGLIGLPTAISRSFGFGRLSRFALGPAFNFTVVKPMEKLFNRIYTPEGYTRPQAAALLRHELINASDYVNICLDQGFPPSKAAVLYELEEKELADAWLKRLADMGWIKEPEIKKELTRRGFSPERAGVLSRLIRDDRKLDLIDKVLSAAADLYKDGVLEKRSLEGYLTTLSYSPEEIALYITRLEFEKSRRRFLTQAQVVQLWLTKKLGRNECKNYLVNLLSMTAEDAELYMSLKSPAI